MLKPSATSPNQLNSQQPRGSCSSLEAALPALEAVPMVTGRRGKGKRRDAWRPLKVWPCARQALTSQTCQGQGTVKVHGGGRGPFPQSQAHSLPSETGDLDGGTETRTPVPLPQPLCATGQKLQDASCQGPHSRHILQELGGMGTDPSRIFLASHISAKEKDLKFPS